MLGLGVSSSLLGGTAFALENSILAAFKTRVLDDSGEVENYACLNLEIKDLITEPAPFTTGLLDFYHGAAAAYSLRQLRRSVSPYAIRVRRSSDDTEQDIGFNSNGELDTNALLDFAGTGDAHVSKWYDQSSNGNDATQGTNVNQPQIVSSGSVLIKNGKPALNFDGTVRYLTSTATTDYSSGLLTACVFSGRFYPLSVQSDNDNGFRHHVKIDGMRARFNTTNLDDNTSTSFNDDQVLQILTFDGTTGGHYVNDQTGVTGSVSVSNTSSMIKRMGSLAYENMTYTGNIQEIIMYDSDQSSNRTGIAANINDFYSIYS